MNTKVQLERTHPCDVGILLVHGIGEQRKGDTLVEFGGPFSDCLEARLSNLASSVGRKSRPTARVEMEAVQLHRANSNTPAYSEIKLSNIDKLRQPGRHMKASPLVDGSLQSLGGLRLSLHPAILYGSLSMGDSHATGNTGFAFWAPRAPNLFQDS